METRRSSLLNPAPAHRSFMYRVLILAIRFFVLTRAFYSYSRSLAFSTRIGLLSQRARDFLKHTQRSRIFSAMRLVAEAVICGSASRATFFKERSIKRAYIGETRSSKHLPFLCFFPFSTLPPHSVLVPRKQRMATMNVLKRTICPLNMDTQ